MITLRQELLRRDDLGCEVELVVLEDLGGKRLVRMTAVQRNTGRTVSSWGRGLFRGEDPDRALDEARDHAEALVLV